LENEEEIQEEPKESAEKQPEEAEVEENAPIVEPVV
jgi:hypothetical protein